MNNNYFSFVSTNFISKGAERWLYCLQPRKNPKYSPKFDVMICLSKPFAIASERDYVYPVIVPECTRINTSSSSGREGTLINEISQGRFASGILNQRSERIALYNICIYTICIQVSSTIARTCIFSNVLINANRQRKFKGLYPIP